MLLDKIRGWFVVLPTLRGWPAARAYTIITLSLFLFGGILAVTYNFFFLQGKLNPGDLGNLSVMPTPVEAKDVPGPINGILYTATEAKVWQSKRPLAVVVENHADSRPQSGLSSADAVYEAIAEGGITRFLALYLTNSVPVSLGPVRSMRIYFLDWLEEYDAVASHVGGNVVAISRIGPEKVKDLDQFYNASTYDRTKDRLAPHNVYTTTERLWTTAEAKGFGGLPSFRIWKFKDEAQGTERPTSQILRLGFGGKDSYKVTWTYSQEKNSYLRSVAGAPQIDRNNNLQIEAKTVVVAVMTYQTGLSFLGDPAARIGTIGSAVAHVFTDGVVTTGTWSKASRTDRTIITSANGQEIPFNRGPIWIEVVPTGSEVSF